MVNKNCTYQWKQKAIFLCSHLEIIHSSYAVADEFSFAPRLSRITFSFSSIYRRWLFQICLSAWFCIHTPACFLCRRAICDALFLREINIPVSISQLQQQGRSRSSKKKQRSVCERRHILCANCLQYAPSIFVFPIEPES